MDREMDSLNEIVAERDYFEGRYEIDTDDYELDYPAEITDPQHPDYLNVLADIYDIREGK